MRDSLRLDGVIAEVFDHYCLANNKFVLTGTQLLAELGDRYLFYQGDTKHKSLPLTRRSLPRWWIVLPEGIWIDPAVCGVVMKIARRRELHIARATALAFDT